MVHDALLNESSRYVRKTDYATSLTRDFARDLSLWPLLAFMRPCLKYFGPKHDISKLYKLEDSNSFRPIFATQKARVNL